MKSLLLTLYASFVTCLLESITIFACSDINDVQTCAAWVRQNQCKLNPGYMNKWCKKSCGICVACEDKNKHCDYWSKQGHCTGKQREFMSKNCRLSCRICCEDVRNECKRWKEQGFCTRSEKYMNSKCPESCGKCDVSQWSTWKSWSSCSKSCGKGEKRRERICKKGKCKGISFEIGYCNSNPCPVMRNLQCGESSLPAFAYIGRVVGGIPALAGEFPWQVGLVKARNGRKPSSSELPFCGGTLIKPNIVLTAAHCFRTVRYAKDFFVRVGDLDMNTKGDYEKTVVVKKLITHEKFNIQTYKDDIAIVVLNEKLSLNDHVNLACLPDKDISISSCTVTGWGRTAAGGLQAKELQKADLPIVTRSVCNTAYKKLFPDREEIIGKNMICAGYKGGLIDACQGDSGGPLVCKQSNGKYVLNGIVSWGVGCAEKERYGVYTNTYNYMDWIKSQLDKIRKEFP